MNSPFGVNAPLRLLQPLLPDGIMSFLEGLPLQDGH